MVINVIIVGIVIALICDVLCDLAYGWEQDRLLDKRQKKNYERFAQKMKDIDDG